MLPILDILKQFETAFGGDGMKMVKEYNAALKKAGGDASKVNVGDYITDMNMGTKIQSLETIFGKRTIGDVLVLLNEGTDKIAEFSNTLLNSGGAAADMANAMRQSLLVQIQILQSALTELGFKFVSAFADQGIDIVQRLTDAVNSFDVTPVVKAVQFAANAIMGVVGAVWQMRGAIAVIIGVWAAWKAIVYGAVIAMKTYEAVNFAVTLATKGTAAAQALLNTSTATGKTLTLLLAGAQKVAAAAQKAAAAATWLFNAAQAALNFLFASSPIGWIVLAIAGLAGAIVLLTKHWQAWGETVTGVLEIIAPPIGILIAMIHGLVENWGAITQAFKDEGIIAGLKMLGSTLLQSIVEPVKALGENIAPALAAAWEGIKSFFAGVITGIAEFFSGIFASIGAFFAGVWEHINGFFSTIWEGITGFFDMVWQGVLGIVEKIRIAVQPLMDFITGIFDGITTAWQSLVAAFTADGLVGALQQIGGAILSFILAPVEKVMDGLAWIPGIGDKIAEWQNSLASFRAELTGGDTTTTAPITARDAQSIQTERYINETTSSSNVTIGLERGLTARVSGAAPNVRVSQYHSGAF